MHSSLGRPRLLDRFGLRGIVPWVVPPTHSGPLPSAAQITGLSYDGGYADSMVAPASALALVPSDLSAVEAGPLMCAGVTTFNALRNSGARPGDVVAILGVGGLGHLGVQFAAQMGLKTVAIAPGEDKEPLARKLDAWHYIDSQVQEPAAELVNVGGARVILATVTSGEAMRAVLGGLGVRGTLVVLGAAESLAVSPLLLIAGRRSVVGWYSGTSIAGAWPGVSWDGVSQHWPCLGHTLWRKPTDPLRRAIKREELGLLETGLGTLGDAQGLADIGLGTNGNRGTDHFPLEGKPEPSEKGGGLLFQVRHGDSGACGRRAYPTDDEREDTRPAHDVRHEARLAAWHGYFLLLMSRRAQGAWPRARRRRAFAFRYSV